MVILDASVAAKLFITEADSDQAERLLSRAQALIAPDLVLVEVANALHKAWRREVIDDVQMDRAIRRLPTIFGRLFPTPDLVADAAIISRIVRHPVPDCIYIAPCTGAPARRSLQPTWDSSKPQTRCRLGKAAPSACRISSPRHDQSPRHPRPRQDPHRRLRLPGDAAHRTAGAGGGGLF